jgi:phosphatidylinositol-3-phosphatase
MKRFLHSLALLFSVVFVTLLLTVTSGTVFSQPVFPVPDHIVVAIFENHAYSQIIGSTAAPYINALAIDPYSALFIQSYAIEHPSQPNYLDLFSGCSQGVINNDFPAVNPFNTANLGRQLIDAGKTFTTYSEDLPGVGFNGGSSGSYARKHNPVANWMGIGANQIPETTNQPFSAFPSTDFALLPTVCFVVPNQDNNMHDGTDPSRITNGDTWLYNNLSSYIEWTKTNNSLFILTFDEGDDLSGNQITTIFIGKMVTAGQYNETINHYTILRTIEDMYGLPYACNASTATPISDCWNVANGVNESEPDDNIFSVYPNPSSGTFNIHMEWSTSVKSLSFEIYNMFGEKVYEEILTSPYSKEIHLNNISSGFYFVKVSDETKTYTKKLIVQ